MSMGPGGFDEVGPDPADIEQTEPEFDEIVGEVPDMTQEEYDAYYADVLDDRREHADRDEGRI